MPHNVQPDQEPVLQGQIPAVQGETGSGAGTWAGERGNSSVTSRYIQQPW